MSDRALGFMHARLCVLALASVVVALGSLWAAGSVRAVTVTDFSHGITAGSRPFGITAGPDGNLWFTEFSGNRVGRITPAGVVTEFAAGITANSGPTGITAGPDGNLWFTELKGNRIGRITPSGVVTEFAADVTAQANPLDVTAYSSPSGITAGPDGNVWFTEQGGHRVGRITPAGVLTEFSPVITGGLGGIVTGPDGNLWFTDGDRVGRITPSGQVTEFSDGATGSNLYGIAAGPDGNLWFTASFPPAAGVGRITPSGHVSPFFNVMDPKSGMRGIAAGPDRNLWFTEYTNDTEVGGNRVGRITPSGEVTEFSASSPYAIAAGPDGNLWFTELDAARIGRITTATSPPAARVAILSRTATVGSGGAAKLTLACRNGAGRCVGKLTLTTKMAMRTGHRMVIQEVNDAGTARFSIAAGHRATIKLTLNRAGLSLLAHAKHHRASTQATAKTNANTARRPIILAERSR